MNKNKFILGLLLVLLALILSACAPPADSATEAAVNNTNETSSREEVANAVLIYERSGGLKGLGPSVQDWRLYGDGRIEGSDGNSWQVDPESVQNLITSILDSGFADLEASYVPEDTCCDRATHRITVQTDENSYTVETLDAADMPQSLTENLDAINLFLMNLYE